MYETMKQTSAVFKALLLCFHIFSVNILNMRNILSVSMMIGFICIFQSCGKRCPSGPYYSPTASQTNKCSFKPASYWIYQDSASGIIDSQFVFAYSDTTHVLVGSTIPMDGRWCDIYGDIFSMSVASFWNGVGHDSIGFGNDIEGFTGTDILFIFSHSHSESDIYSFSAVPNSQTVTLTNFSVSGQTFPTVYRDNINLNSQIYRVDNVGVVKWVFNDTINGQRTWNLLRYHVINP